MATTLTAHWRHIDSETTDSFSEVSTAATATQRNSTTLITRDADTKEWTSVGLASQYHPTWIGWRSTIVDAEFTLSGEITFVVLAGSSVADAGRVHVKLFKRTSGGSNVETLIAQGDAATNITAAVTTFTFAVTPPTPVTVARGERLLWRFFTKRQSADFDTATFTLRYDTASSTRFTLTETVTMLPDTVILIMRRTADNAIGNFFDLLPTRGVTASTTGVVNTVASGTEIQWTRTAGGTVLEWITPRFKGPWALVVVEQAGASMKALTAHESNLAANCSVRLKMFRRRPDGTETLMVTWSETAELTTSANRYSLPAATLDDAMTFAEDDRIVARAYIINVGVMGGSRTCTIGYDHTSATTGDTAFSLADMAEFKAEGDPAAISAPSGLAMSGLGS